MLSIICILMAPHDLREEKGKGKQKGRGVSRKRDLVGGCVGKVEFSMLIWFGYDQGIGQIIREVFFGLVDILLKVSTQKTWGHGTVLGWV